MALLPRDSVNTEVALSTGVQVIADFMRRESGRAELSTRALMILTAIDEMVLTGPVDFNAGRVCDRLNVKHPMVNHYFGSRDSLITEVTMWAYRAWSDQLVSAVKSAPPVAEKRIRAYIAAELTWSQRMKAVALLIQYPLLSENVKSRIETEFTREMQELFEYHLALMTTLVIDLRTGTNSALDFDVDSYPRTRLVSAHPREFLDASSIAWSVHGLAIWSSESHSPTRNFAGEAVKNISISVAIKNHINNIIAIAKG